MENNDTIEIKEEEEHFVDDFEEYDNIDLYDENAVHCLSAIENYDVAKENEKQQYFHLKNICIFLPFEVPAIHRIETRISQRPTPAQREQLEDLTQGLGVKIKQGIYSSQEDQIIRENFIEFCKSHDLEEDPTPFLNLSYTNCKDCLMPYLERLKFVQYLARGLENRQLFSVYFRFKLLYSTFKKGRYTTDEDNMILYYVSKFRKDRKKFSNLAKVLGRDRNHIVRRYWTLIESKRVKYSNIEKKTEKIIKSMMEVLQTDDVNDLKHRKLTSEQWKSVSVMVEGTERCYDLKHYWYSSVYSRLFISRPTNINKILKEIVEKLYMDNVRDFKLIKWKTLAKPYKHKFVTKEFLYYKMYFLFLQHTNKSSSFKKRVKQLKNLFDNNQKLCPKVKPIGYEDGKVLFYKYLTDDQKKKK